MYGREIQICIPWTKEEVVIVCVYLVPSLLDCRFTQIDMRVASVVVILIAGAIVVFGFSRLLSYRQRNFQSLAESRALAIHFGS